MFYKQILVTLSPRKKDQSFIGSTKIFFLCTPGLFTAVNSCVQGRSNV